MGSTVFYTGSNELATLTNTFSVAGVATDPTTVTLAVTTPTGTTTTYTYSLAEIIRDSTGVYHKDIACSEAGTWAYVWTGTGAASDVIAGTWKVDSAPTSDLYCTPEMLKGRTGINDNLDDAEILAACRSVSRWIDDTHCERTFARRTATMQIDTHGYYSLQVPDLVSVTTLKTDDDRDGVYETTWSVTDYELQPVNATALLESKPYTSIAAVGSRLFPVTCTTGRKPRAQIVGVWGWPTIPAGVSEGAAILATDFLAAGGTKFGVIGFEGFAMRARLNPLALSMLEGYRKYPVKVA